MLLTARPTTNVTDATDVVVIGAGLSGLSAAHHLTNAGLKVTVVEAALRVGGRMATDTVDGFRLDRGPQLLNTSYPELRRTPGLHGVALRPFAPGAVVRTGARTATRALDRARLRSALGRLAATPAERLLARPETTAAAALSAAFAPRAVDGFLRPLLAALLCDDRLGTSSRCADLVLRAFALGRTCLPAGAPPRAGPARGRAAAGRVTAGGTGGGGRHERRGAGGRRLPRRPRVVVATGARAAGELLPGLRVPGFHGVTVVHHAAPGMRCASPRWCWTPAGAGPSRTPSRPASSTRPAPRQGGPWSPP